MGNLTIASTISPETFSSIKGLVIGELTAGEAITAGHACYLKSADGLIWESISTATEDFTYDGDTWSREHFLGFAAKSYASGATLSLFGRGCILNYGSSLTPGAYYYASATKGLLSTTAVASTMEPIAMAISTTEILVLR